MIVLGHGHTFESLEAVKAEVSPKVLDLVPNKCSNIKEIPFITVGKDIGERAQVFKSEDGTIIVEDVKEENQTAIRQVVFSDKPEMVQSEVQLVYRNTKKGDFEEYLKTSSPVCPKKKQRVLVLNHDFLCAEYQYSMLSGFSLPQNLIDKDQIRILVLGTGAGLVPMFLRS